MKAPVSLWSVHPAGTSNTAATNSATCLSRANEQSLLPVELMHSSTREVVYLFDDFVVKLFFAGGQPEPERKGQRRVDLHLGRTTPGIRVGRLGRSGAVATCP